MTFKVSLLNGRILNRWPNPVDGAEFLDGVAALIRLYVHMPAPAADAVALWIAHTWLHDRLKKSTFLNLTSATKQCGKTALMEVLATLFVRPMPVSGKITPAALFRTICQRRSKTSPLNVMRYAVLGGCPGSP